MFYISIIVFILYCAYAVYSAVMIRRDLSLGNGAALGSLYLCVSSVLIAVLTTPMKYWIYVVAVVIGYILFILLGLINVIPIINRIAMEFAMLYKKALRVWIPREKIDEALRSKYGISLSELEKKFKDNK